MGSKHILIKIRGISGTELQIVLRAISDVFNITSIRLQQTRGYHSER